MNFPQVENKRVNKGRWFEMLGYQPHEEQNAFHCSNARFRVVVAGRRWGKSLSAAKEAETMILFPQTRGWVVSKTYDLAWKVLREIYNDLVVQMQY